MNRDRDQILTILLTILPSELERVILRSNVPQCIMPTNSQAQRALALMQYFEQPGRSIFQLAEIINGKDLRPHYSVCEIIDLATGKPCALVTFGTLSEMAKAVSDQNFDKRLIALSFEDVPVPKVGHARFATE